jgi:predicted phosphoribosyltransferase
MFKNRHDAGCRLAEYLQVYRGPDTIVLAIPRGGVVVGYEVAVNLDAPLDVIVPRKIGAPIQPELAIGAIAGDDILVLDEVSIRQLGVSRERLEEEIREQRQEMLRRERVYRGDRPPLDLEGKTVILVDDGVATGSTTMAAARALRMRRPGKLILAVPVAPPDSARRLEREVDELVVLETPEPFYAVGVWYAEFGQTSDEEVLDLLERAADRIGYPPEGKTKDEGGEPEVPH